MSPSTTPATWNEGGCQQVPHLPREMKVDVTLCHACHAKWRGAPGDQRRPTATNGDQARHQVQQVPHLPRQTQVDLALFSSCLVALGVFFVAKLNACDVFKCASSLSLKLFTTIIDAKVLSWLTVWPVLFYYGRIQDWGSRTLWLVQGSACPWDSWSFSLIHDAVKMNCCCSSGPLHDMYGTDPWNYLLKLHV